MPGNFPPDFLFGCSTSAYQIEGGIENDWSDWEAAGRLKDPSARCAQATDHWNRFEEDFELLASLSARAYRMSVEWARVEPADGVFSEPALARYSLMIDRLRSLGIEPFVTLLHFTHPRWFHELCPWHAEQGEGARRFLRFVQRVVARLGDRVRYWTVLNEPMVWLVGAYLAGALPPGRKSVREMFSAFSQLVRAHGLAYHEIKRHRPDALVGIAQNVLSFSPSRRRHLGDRALTAYAGGAYNHAMLRALTRGRARLGLLGPLGVDRRVPEAEGTLDFIGVNYYSRLFLELHPWSAERFDAFYEDRSGHGTNDLGWELYPEGLGAALQEMSRYGLPLFITENGLDDRTDSRRAAYLYDHLSAVKGAIERGLDVRGYLHWSLLDNFEWLEGFGPRFGLVEVDYANLERRVRPSALFYADIMRARALPAERPAETVHRGEGRRRPW